MILSPFTVFHYIPGRANYKDNDYASRWLKYTEASLDVSRYGIKDIDFSIIADDKKIEYINRLEYIQYVELEQDEYFKLTKKKLEKKFGLAIRAVYAHLGGGFRVQRNYWNEYFIDYIVMGSRVWEINKSVLIIEADELPRELFISYVVVK